MKAGWYKVEPYAAAHFFHDATKSGCGIEWRQARATHKPAVYCDICRISTGRIPNA